MSHGLSIEDFPAFFEEVHGHPPFPWQTRLVRKVAEEGQWPHVLDLPTGFGKTAALDVAVFHLALEAHLGGARRAPLRVALVVDRRLAVDDAFARARAIANALAHQKGGTIASVADRLRILAGEGSPCLIARRLRGGVPREDDWARSPSQPTILSSTVDQLGSRLLFRGYGVSDSMKPVHAGLLGADCLILLDEAHLSEPFRQTLTWVQRYKGQSWRESKDAPAPWGAALLTATPGMADEDRFRPDEDDYANSVLARRWAAPKPARLIDLSGYNFANSEGSRNDAKQAGATEQKRRIAAIMSEVRCGLKALRDGGLRNPALAVVVNRVARAREVFEQVRDAPDLTDVEPLLMIGPARPVERDVLAELLTPIRTGKQDRSLEKPLLIVSTQCIEAGVDIDLDGLITEAAPIDTLRQRFGRLNRGGRESVQAYGAILGGLKADEEDPIYGEAVGRAWKYLISYADEAASRKKPATADLGLRAFAEKMNPNPIPDDALSPKADAPILLPAHLDLLSHTAPVPAADPQVSLYLHGPDRTADAVTVIWRADVSPDLGRDPDSLTRRLLLLMPPRATEAVELPVWAVRKWLQDADLSELADIPTPESEAGRSRPPGGNGRVFRWAGDDDRSAWIAPEQIRPGDAIIVPTDYGGVDQYGWNPSAKPATDVADQAAMPFAGHRFVARIAPGLLKNPHDESHLAKAIASVGGRQWETLRDAIMEVGLPEPIARNLDRLSHARRKKGRAAVEVYADAYGYEDGWPRGAVFVAPFGIEGRANEEAEEGGLGNATEDDVSGSLPGFSLSLERHSEEVERMAEQFARAAGLPEHRVLDLKLAGHLHDLGKADPRFQAWLAYGDPLGPDADHPNEVLAKSARPVPRDARAASGLPDRWRHEALSVRLAPLTSRFAQAKDPELLLWLIGTHHGHGRPLFPHTDPEDARLRSHLPRVLDIPRTLPPGHGPQSLAYDWNGSDWPGLHERLNARYGAWELARMEAILRLADHRASERSARAGPLGERSTQ